MCLREGVRQPTVHTITPRPRREHTEYSFHISARACAFVRRDVRARMCDRVCACMCVRTPLQPGPPSHARATPRPFIRAPNRSPAAAARRLLHPTPRYRPKVALLTPPETILRHSIARHQKRYRSFGSLRLALVLSHGFFLPNI